MKTSCNYFNQQKFHTVFYKKVNFTKHLTSLSLLCYNSGTREPNALKFSG